MANYLRSVGVQKGDAVSIYMPMVNELPIAMLACARIGAVHSVVFGGFSAEALGGAHASASVREHATGWAAADPSPLCPCHTGFLWPYVAGP